ncbi:C39 family peptidase [Neobacillus sp. D3-1R]|uniref:C39 family peptidase n=1 Tax=Neobacillus sp. D3-1R TaxID=3445778 RepID=UPI003F9F579C
MSKILRISILPIFLVFFLSIFSNHSYAISPIKAPHIKQMPELPRGCEVTSLAMMLEHGGIKVNKMQLAKEVQKVPYKKNGLYGNPYDGFIGNMYTFNAPGLGVYHGPIQDLAEKYLQNRVVNLTGHDFSYVYQMLDQGQPVWVITNSWFKRLPSSQFITWQTSTGPLRITYREHSVLVTGYDSKYIYINDPLYPKANRAVKKQDFIDSWNQMGKQAISYYPKNTNWYIDTFKHPYTKEIQQLSKLGFESSLENGFYQPDKIISRLETKKLFSKISDEGSQSNKSGAAFSDKGNLTKSDLSRLQVETFDLDIESSTSEPSITDVPNNHKDFPYIQAVSDSKIIPINQDGSFKPNRPVTKGELASILTKAINMFWYEDTLNHWARDEISYLKRNGIVKGNSPTTFGPNEPITRAQAAVILDRALQLDSTNAKKSDGSASSITKMVQLGYWNENTATEPTKPLMKKEMAQLLATSFQLNSPETPQTFEDVSPSSEFYDYIQALSGTRMISAGSQFNPEKPVTRAQFASLLAKLLIARDKIDSKTGI